MGPSKLCWSFNWLIDLCNRNITTLKVLKTFHEMKVQYRNLIVMSKIFWPHCAMICSAIIIKMEIAAIVNCAIDFLESKLWRWYLIAVCSHVAKGRLILENFSLSSSNLQKKRCQIYSSEYLFLVNSQESLILRLFLEISAKVKTFWD